MIEDLERSAMNLLLAGDDPMLAALRRQYREVVSRTYQYTGVGMYIHFSTSDSKIASSNSSSFCFGDIEAEISPPTQRIGFLLWVKNGALSNLEIYTYSEPWPDRIEDFQVFYIDGSRDLASLQESWS